MSGHTGVAIFAGTALAERDTSWQNDKILLCTLPGNDPDLWFPKPLKNSERAEAERYNREVRRAQLVCSMCPARRECLKDALSRNERYGIWGGVDMSKLKGRVAS